MSYLIQHGKIRSQMINIPEGLPELLSDITREVLRCQPNTECMCQFIIDYLHSIIMAQEKARAAKMIIDRALRNVDEIIVDLCICDTPQAKANEMSEIMEECFKNFLARRRCEKSKHREIIKFNEIDMLDELIRKCKFSEDDLKLSRPVIEIAYQKFVHTYMSAQENTEGTEALYQYFREREMKRLEERIRQEAATKIQANFRGFLVRRSILPYRETKMIEESSEDEEQKLKNEEAARKIQQYYRRHKNLVDKQNIVTLESTIQQVAVIPESNISHIDYPGQEVIISEYSKDGVTHDQDNYASFQHEEQEQITVYNEENQDDEIEEQQEENYQEDLESVMDVNYLINDLIDDVENQK